MQTSSAGTTITYSNQFHALTYHKLILMIIIQLQGGWQQVLHPDSRETNPEKEVRYERAEATSQEDQGRLRGELPDLPVEIHGEGEGGAVAQM